MRIANVAEANYRLQGLHIVVKWLIFQQAQYFLNFTDYYDCGPAGFPRQDLAIAALAHIP